MQRMNVAIYTWYNFFSYYVRPAMFLRSVCSVFPKTVQNVFVVVSMRIMDLCKFAEYYPVLRDLSISYCSWVHWSYFIFWMSWPSTLLIWKQMKQPKAFHLKNVSLQVLLSNLFVSVNCHLCVTSYYWHFLIKYLVLPINEVRELLQP